jgi:hypothetical protein
MLTEHISWHTQFFCIICVEHYCVRTKFMYTKHGTIANVFNHYKNSNVVTSVYELPNAIKIKRT